MRSSIQRKGPYTAGTIYSETISYYFPTCAPLIEPRHSAFRHAHTCAPTARIIIVRGEKRVREVRVNPRFVALFRKKGWMISEDDVLPKTSLFSRAKLPEQSVSRVCNQSARRPGFRKRSVFSQVSPPDANFREKILFPGKRAYNPFAKGREERKWSLTLPSDALIKASHSSLFLYVDIF